MRFCTSYTNRRHNSYGAAILPGDPVHTRGWDAGVTVTAHDDNGRDSFVVRMTTGSHEKGPAVDLGTVHDTPDGPQWIPAHTSSDHKLPGTMASRARAILAEWDTGLREVMNDKGGGYRLADQMAALLREIA